MSTVVRIAQSLTVLGQTFTFRKDPTVDQVDVIDQLEVPDQTSDLEVDFNPGLFTKMAFLEFVTTGELTIKSNDATTPDFTLTDLDGVAEWMGGAVQALGGTGITKLYLTNASGAMVKFSAFCGRDVTPG